MIKRRFAIMTSLLLLLLVLTIIASMSIGGTVKIDLLAGGSLSSMERDILINIRLPRSLMACLIGASLAVAGAALQFFFRNPLCSPFTLGVSGGAALGAVLGMKLRIYATPLGNPGIYLSSLGIAFLTVMVVYRIARRSGGRFTDTLLLAGVVVNFFLSSFIMFVEYLSSFEGSFEIIAWLMGSLQVTGYRTLKYSLLAMIPGWILLFVSVKWFNIISLGEETAATAGADIWAIQKRIYFSTSLLTGVAVTSAGPIGFVGLLVPHILRLMVGADSRLIIPGSFLLGASFLLISDVVARTIISPAEIPVGILTAITGGPFFLFLLLRSRR